MASQRSCSLVGCKAAAQTLHVTLGAASQQMRLLEDKPWPARFACYVVTRPGTRERTEVQAFIEWLMAEA